MVHGQQMCEMLNSTIKHNSSTWWNDYWPKKFNSHEVLLRSWDSIQLINIVISTQNVNVNETLKFIVCPSLVISRLFFMEQLCRVLCFTSNFLSWWQLYDLTKWFFFVVSRFIHVQNSRATKKARKEKKKERKSIH